MRRAYHKARYRALDKCLAFTIDPHYLDSIFPTDYLCPVFGTQMEWGGNKDTSPSLDRIFPAIGYVPGNVMWISTYANTLKNANSLDTLKRLVSFYEDKLKVVH